MPSVWTYTAAELPYASYERGRAWTKRRLEAEGYTQVQVTWLGDEEAEPIKIYVWETNVSRDQIKFDTQGQDGALTAGLDPVHCNTGQTVNVQINGPKNKTVQVFVKGVCFMQTKQFTIPEAGNYQFGFGPPPPFAFATEPIEVSFEVTDDRVSPVAVGLTFG